MGEEKHLFKILLSRQMYLSVPCSSIQAHHKALIGLSELPFRSIALPVFLLENPWHSFWSPANLGSKYSFSIHKLCGLGHVT